MNIWNWVHRKENELRHQGETRLADIMDLIPSYACDDKHELVDTIFPEGLQHARRLGDKWVELFLRHWYLQSKVLHRKNVRDMLNEAVDLLAFAHSEETRDCPQRICVVQDLAASYAIKDGAAFVEERLAVCNEAFAEINPDWACYDCIATEYSFALLDANRDEELLSSLEHFQAERSKAGKSKPSTDFAIIYATALMKSGQLGEAEQLLSDASIQGGGESFLRKQSLLLALISAKKGEFERAKTQSVPFNEVLLSQDHFNGWCDLQFELAIHDAIEIDEKLLRRFHYLSSQLQKNGAIRKSFQITQQVCELSLKADCPFSAHVGLVRIGELIPELHKDLGASQIEADLRQKIRSILAENRFHTLKNIDDVLALAGKEPEQNLDHNAVIYLNALQQWSSHAELIMQVAKQYENYFLQQQAQLLLVNAFRNNRHDEKLRYEYGLHLLNHSGYEAFLAEFDQINKAELSEEGLLDYLWLYAHAYANTDTPLAIKYLEEYLEKQPENVQVLQKTARMYMDIENYSKATVLWTHIIHVSEDNKHYHWDRLIATSIEKQWDLVRESAAALDIKLESQTGPVCESMGKVLIQFREQGQEPERFIAHRTGPVTALIKGIGNIEEKQRYHYEVVFDPAPLNTLDEKDEEGYACDAEGHYYLIFPVIKITKAPAFFMFDIEGVDPGETVKTELKDALAKLGGVLSQRNSEEYRIHFEEHNKKQELPGFYAYILIPEQENLECIKALLDDKTAHLQHPLIWPKLLERLSDKEGLLKQQAIEERYNL